LSRLRLAITREGDQHLAKPVAPDTLSRLIQVALGRSGTA